MKTWLVSAAGALALSFFAIPSGGSAQAPMFGHGDGPVEAAERRRVIDGVLERLHAQYVFPEVAQAMERSIRAKEKAGEYASLGTGKAFAAKLSGDLNAVAHDKHLGVFYYDAAMPAAGGGGAPDPKAIAAFRRNGERSNFGFPEVRVLAGNVGYVKLTGFTMPEWGGETVAAAMKFVGNTDALIFDLRGNHGGSAEMVQLVMSYLVPARTHLNDIYSRPDSSTRQMWSLPSVPGGRYSADKPVYVLADARTISAGEEFAYDVQTQKRGTVVGDVTAGAANPGGLDRIDDHFAMFLPRGRAINPVTKTNWEGVGVKPDVPVAAERALEAAHLAALRLLLPKVEDPDEAADLRVEIQRLEKAAAAGPGASGR